MAIVVNIDALINGMGQHRNATDRIMVSLQNQKKAFTELNVDSLTQAQKDALLAIAQKRLDELMVSEYVQTDAEARRIFAATEPEPTPDEE